MLDSFYFSYTTIDVLFRKKTRTRSERFSFI